MTVETTTFIIQYNGDGATVTFATGFKFLANSDITVTHRDSSGVETTWTLDTQFTMAGAGDDAGGTLTVNTSPTDYTPASGETLTIQRVTAKTQATDYPAGGSFPSSAHEDALDRLTMIAQETAVSGGGTVLEYPITDAATLTGVLPNSSDRASKFAAWDAAGEPIASTGPTGDSSIPVSTFMETVLDDTTAAAARSTLAALGSTSAGGSLTGIHVQGKQTIWVPARAIEPRVTTGPSRGVLESSTNKVTTPTLDFDTGSQEFAQFSVAFPKGWNAGTVTAQLHWTAASSSGGVVFGFAAMSLADSDVLDTAFGTRKTISDTLLTALDVHVSSATGAITIAGSPGDNEEVHFQIDRDVGNGGDTLGADASILGVRIFYTTDAKDDT